MLDKLLKKHNKNPLLTTWLASTINVDITHDLLVDILEYVGAYPVSVITHKLIPAAEVETVILVALWE